MSVAEITKLLVDEGQRLFRQPREFVPFTGDGFADRRLNDIVRMPHLFVLGCVVDRQVKAERAWAIPIRLAVAAGGTGFRTMERLSPRRIRRVLRGPPALHRFPEAMSIIVRSAISRMRSSYQGDASRIWNDRPSSAEVVIRFLEFDGVGPKIATMAANILARQFKVRFADYYAIDISADVHVRRVFRRLGLVNSRSPVEHVVYRARAMHPEFPGLLDMPAFRVGRAHCKPHNPHCAKCFLARVCPTASGEFRMAG